MPTFSHAAAAAGVRDPRVLAALETVPRERFVPVPTDTSVERDAPVPLPLGQTTSQPSLVALMVEALRLEGPERVLEVGTGLGFQAALLGRLAAEVWTVEWHAELAAAATENLAAAGLRNVHVAVGDGRAGLPEHAPYDAVIVAAQTPDVPPALVDQLADGGRLVAPVGDRGEQRAVAYVREGDRLRPTRVLARVRFVPLLG